MAGLEIRAINNERDRKLRGDPEPDISYREIILLRAIEAILSEKNATKKALRGYASGALDLWLDRLPEGLK